MLCKFSSGYFRLGKLKLWLVRLCRANSGKFRLCQFRSSKFRWGLVRTGYIRLYQVMSG